MPFKPIPEKLYLKYLSIAKWKLEKGSIDWKLYDEEGAFVCSIKISHGKGQKKQVVAHSVKKTEFHFQQKGLSWPPKKK